MELTKVKTFIKLEAERVFPTENYSLQELWIKENFDNNGEVPFFCFSQSENHTLLLRGHVDVDIHYSMDLVSNQELTDIIDEYVLFGFSCYSIRG